MHRGTTPAFSLRKVNSFDSFDSDDFGDQTTPKPRPPPPPSSWYSRLFLPRRRLRNYVLLGLGILAIFLLTRSRSRRSGNNPYLRYEAVDWSRYAYSQVAFNGDVLCNSLMLFDTLHRTGSRAQRIMFYPENWKLKVSNEKDRKGQLLLLARDKYKVDLIPITMEKLQGDRALWDPVSSDPVITDHSINKIYTFREAQYDRIIHIDSDVDLYQNLDELFFLPPAQAAMPRAYWEGAHSGVLSPKLMLLQPSYREYKLLMDVSQGALHGQVATNVSRGYDMDLFNQRFASSAMVLPHRQYGLTTQEFRTKDHRTFLGNDYEKWDPDRALADAKLIHFTDSPLPKPWIMWPRNLMVEMLPKCDVQPGTPEESGCRDREVWKKIYDGFRQKRKDVCKLLSYPAPDWPPRRRPEVTIPTPSPED